MADRNRLLIGSCWPILFVSGVTIIRVGYELSRDCWSLSDRTLIAPARHPLAAARAGVESTLPLLLVVTFIFVPSTTTMIFKTFLCDRIEYDDGVTRRYLSDDLALQCDSDEHHMTRNVASLLILVWPVGVPLLYLLLLWYNREGLRAGAQTTTCRAIAFLSDSHSSEYQSLGYGCFWWEPLEMCRKLAVTGVRHRDRTNDRTSDSK